MVTMDEPAIQYSEAQLGAAWIALMATKMQERTTNQQAIEALAHEVYISADDRSARGAQLLKEKTRIENDLIAIGQVLDTCRRMYPNLPDPGVDGLEPA